MWRVGVASRLLLILMYSYTSGVLLGIGLEAASTGVTVAATGCCAGIFLLVPLWVRQEIHERQATSGVNIRKHN